MPSQQPLILSDKLSDYVANELLKLIAMYPKQMPKEAEEICEFIRWLHSLDAPQDQKYAALIEMNRKRAFTDLFKMGEKSDNADIRGKAAFVLDSRRLYFELPHLVEEDPEQDIE